MSRPIRRLAAWLLVLAALAGPAATAPAQEQRVVVPFDGDDAVRYILNRLDLKPLAGIDEAVTAPQKTLLIVFGKTAVLDQLPGGLDAFVSHGGAVLVATDRPTDPAGALATEFDVRITGNFLRAGDSGKAYRGRIDCPFVTAKMLQLGTPVFLGCPQIATNKPSCFAAASKRLPTLALIDTSPGGARDYLPRPIFAAGGDWETGRILVLADHSIFINGMMLHTDNDNFDFAYGSIEWLSANGQRDRVLFVNNGVVVKDFSGSLKPPPISLPKVQVLNELLVGLEKERVFDRMAAGAEDQLRQHVAPHHLLRGLAVGVAAALAGYGILRLSRKAYQATPATAAVGATPVAETTALVEQRHALMLRENNLWEAARERARACFVAIGWDPAAPRGRGERAEPSPPHVQLYVRGWRGHTLRRLVARLWAVAYGHRPRRVTRREYERLAAQADELRRAIDEGRLRLAGPGGRG